MIRFLFVVLVAGVLYANPVSNVQEVTEDKTQKILDQYRNALILYKEKKFQKSYVELNKLFESNLDDPNINFYLGRTAFELGKYEEAIIAYERVLFAKPDNVRAKLEIGRAFYMSKQFQSAKKYFLEVHKDPETPDNIKETLDKFLLAIEEYNQQNSTLKKHILDGFVLVGLVYDSNVQTTADSHVDKYTGLNYIEEKIKDWADQEVVVLKHKYSFDEKTAIKNDLLFYSKNYHDFRITDENVKFISYTPAYSKLLESGVLIDFAVFLDRLWVENDTYMYSYGFFPQLSYAIRNDLLFESSLKLQEKRYIKESDKAKNSVVKEISFGTKYLYDPNSLYGVKLIIARESENNDESAVRIDINKNTYELQTNLLYALNKKLTLNPMLSFKRIHYKDTTSFGVKQEDKEYKLGVLSTYTYSPKWLFQVGGDYTKVDSNLQVYEYHKHTLTFNVIRPF